MRLQNDELSIPARRLLALLRPLTSDDAETQAALQLLQGWNARLDSDSAAAALEEVWFTRHLQPAFKTAVLGSHAAGLFDAPNTQVLLEWLEHATARSETSCCSPLSPQPTRR